MKKIFFTLLFLNFANADLCEMYVDKLFKSLTASRYAIETKNKEQYNLSVKYRQAIAFEIIKHCPPKSTETILQLIKEVDK